MHAACDERDSRQHAACDERDSRQHAACDEPPENKACNQTSKNNQEHRERESENRERREYLGRVSDQSVEERSQPLSLGVAPSDS